jgi:hypothetical protein
MSDLLDPRVAELLSALLDGAVTPEERAVAEEWLERSEAARAEYRTLHQVKSVLGGLGEVDVPFGFYERMLLQGTPTPVATTRAKRRGRVAVVIGSLVASAAGFVLIGGTAAPGTTADPSVAAVAAGRADGVQSLRSGDLGGVRILRQEADGVDWDALPRGERLDRGGFQIWRDLTTDDGEERVVVAKEGVVVTVAADGEDADDLIDLGKDVVREHPADDDDSLAERARDACGNLLRSLSLG